MSDGDMPISIDGPLSMQDAVGSELGACLKEDHLASDRIAGSLRICDSWGRGSLRPLAICVSQSFRPHIPAITVFS